MRAFLNRGVIVVLLIGLISYAPAGLADKRPEKPKNLSQEMGLLTAIAPPISQAISWLLDLFGGSDLDDTSESSGEDPQTDDDDETGVYTDPNG